MESWFPTFQRWTNREIPLPTLWPRAATPAQRYMLLSLLALAIEENLPLVSLLEEWAKDEQSLQQRSRIRRLARLLKSGRPLADAVDEVPGILADEDLLAIRFDAQMGTRTAAVRQVLARITPRKQSERTPVRGGLLYFALIAFTGLVILCFLQIKIIPVFDKMFQESGYPRPQPLLWSIAVGRGLARYSWLLPLAMFIAVWYMLSTQTGRFVRNSVLGRLLQPLRELHAADLLQKLGIASAAGRPIPGALSTLARYHFVPDVRHKLLFVRNEVELGADIFQSMAQVGLLNAPELRVLQTADRVGNRPWILDQLAAVKQRRTHQRLASAARFVLPAVVLLLAGMVLFQALTVLSPLVQLIEANL
jgi:type II secretory pathway component PulF